jgi:ABC-type lipoprotein export system ATPase subunit
MTDTVLPVSVDERPPVIQLHGVERTYARAGTPVRALRGVDLTVHPGELVLLMGPSGCGKTTLLHVLGGLDRADAGEVRVAGVDLQAASQNELDRFRQRHVGVMLQADNLLSTATAGEQIALRLLARGESWRVARRAAREMLARVGLADREDHRPDQLSGGEQQRVALARALAGAPDVVLADEPTGELDSATTSEMLALIAAGNRELGTTFVIATHDPLLASIATRVVHLRDGVVEASP